MSAPISYNEIYFVDSPDLNPLAIRPGLYNDKITWEDTGRGTAIKFTEIVPSSSNSTSAPEKIIITPVNGERQIVLTKLTLALYNQKVKDQVYGQPEFKSDDEVREYFLNTNFF